MRKRKKGRKFSRERDLRRAFLHELARSLILEERMITTEARAKELRQIVDRLFTYERRSGIANRRRVAAVIGTDVEQKLARDLAPRAAARSGGYTRIRKIGPRKSDSARMAIIELVD